MALGEAVCSLLSHGLDCVCLRKAMIGMIESAYVAMSPTTKSHWISCGGPLPPTGTREALCFLDEGSSFL